MLGDARVVSKLAAEPAAPTGARVAEGALVDYQVAAKAEQAAGLPKSVIDNPVLRKARAKKESTKPFQVGETVYLGDSGVPLTIADVSDTALLTLTNERGARLQTGRLSVSRVRPVGGGAGLEMPYKSPTAELLATSMDAGIDRRALNYAMGEANTTSPALNSFRRFYNSVRAWTDPILRYSPDIQRSFLAASRYANAGRLRISSSTVAIRGAFTEVFGADAVAGAQTNRLRYIGPDVAAQRPYVGTIFHAVQFPERYALTAEQRLTLKILSGIQTEDFRLTQLMGVPGEAVEGLYLGRRVAPTVGAARATGGGGGARATFLRHRKEEDATVFFEALSKAKRSAKTDIVDLFQGRMASSAKLRSDLVFLNSMAAKAGGRKLTGSKAALMGEVTVTHNATGLRWAFPEEAGGMIQDFLKASQPTRSSMPDFIDQARAMLLNLDFSVGGLRQGLLGFMASPMGYIRSFAGAWKFVRTPEGAALDMARNTNRMMRWQQRGLQLQLTPWDLPVTKLGESGLWIDKIPGLRQMNNFQFNVLMPKLKMAIAERNLGMLKSAQEGGVVGRYLRDAPLVGRFIRANSAKLAKMSEDDLMKAAADMANNWVGGIEWAKITPGNLGPLRRLVILTEGWTRAQLNAITKSVAFTPEGIIARRLLMQELAISVGIVVALDTLLGGDSDLDPRSYGFGKVEIPGVGRITVMPHAPLIRTFSRMMAGVPAEQQFGTSNPLKQRFEAAVSWSDARAGQFPRMLWDLSSGKDFYGRPIDNKALHVAEALMPIMVQNVADGLRQKNSAAELAGEVVIGFAGANFSPATQSNRLTNLAENLGIARGREWRDLEPFERAQVEVTAAGRAIRERMAGTDYQKRKDLILSFYDEQKARDAALERGKLSTGQPYGPNEWRDDYRSGQSRKAAALEAYDAYVGMEIGTPKNDNQKAFSGYFDLMDAFRLEGGKFDFAGWEQAEARYLAGLSKTQQAYVIRNVNSYGTPLVKEYKEAQIALQPYWDALENTLVSRPDVLEVWEIYNALPAGAEKDAYGLKNRSAISLARSIQSRARESIRMANPVIDGLLVKWYEYKPMNVQNMVERRSEVMESLAAR